MCYLWSKFRLLHTEIEKSNNIPFFETEVMSEYMHNKWLIAVCCRVMDLGSNSLGKPHHLSKFADVLHLMAIVINNWYMISKGMSSYGSMWEVLSTTESYYSGFPKSQQIPKYIHNSMDHETIVSKLWYYFTKWYFSKMPWQLTGVCFNGFISS